jgi:acetyl-CoA acetyltransferase
VAPTQYAPASLHRPKEGLGIWEHRGKVAAAGIGFSPTDRRWDERVETSIGAYALIAAQNALDDAGISAEDVDGLVVTTSGTGDPWAPRPIPEDFAKRFQLTDNRNDGLSMMSAEWMVKNMPGLKNVKAAYHVSSCVSEALAVGAQMVGDGLCNNLLIVRALNNLGGRYQHSSGYSTTIGGQGSQNAEDTASGGSQWDNPFGWGHAVAQYAYLFDQYCRKYGSNHDRMAPFVVNQRRNGLMCPEGWYYQHPEPQLTVEDYLASRWIVKPACLHDCDRPIQTSICFLYTTAERARDMKQPPVYILNHISNRPKVRSTLQTLEECEASTDAIARKLTEGSGLTAGEVDVYNPYDGFTLFTQYYLESFGWHGVNKGEAHDFYAGDISVEGPHPLSSSGGNNGCGRTRCWMHTDCIQQLRGQAGERQVRIKNGRPETAVSGGPTPGSGDWTVWSKYPD